MTLAAGATINTDDGTITGTTVAISTAVVSSTPVNILVVEVGSLHAQDITVTGHRALAIVSDGDVTLNGILDASADHQHPGPGAVLNDPTCQGRDGDKANDGSAISGGGGAGFGTAGGAGGTASFLVSGGAAGASAGAASLVPLRGGCHGGWFGGASGPPGTTEIGSSPGTGGGAVQIASRTSISIGAAGGIAVNGGSAKADTSTNIILCVSGSPCGAGAGAGSGGGILLEAPQVVTASTAVLVANGGAGHCGTKGSAASPGLNATPAVGTDCTTFHGGAGAAGTNAAQDGTARTSNGPTGAGGGGGAGRIRINLPTGASFDAQGAVLSPTPSIGAVGTR